MDNNEGLFGLLNYENTPLEHNDSDTFGKAMAKGSGRAFIDCSTIFGAFCLIASGVNFIKLIKK